MVLTERLELRPAQEADRTRFIEMFGDEAFMAFSGGVLDTTAANARFDRMRELAAEFPFAKQPIIERSSGQIFGYSGVGVFDFEGERRPEYGYRLMPEARGKGYATEAGLALLDLAAATFSGEIIAIIDPTNLPSQNVIVKLGFSFWKEAIVDGYLDRLYRLSIG